MMFRNGGINEMLGFAAGKKLAFYGNNDDLRLLCGTFAPYGLFERLDCVTGYKRDGAPLTFEGAAKPFAALGELLGQPGETVLLFGQTAQFGDLMEVIASELYGKLENTSFYTGGYLLTVPPPYKLPEHGASEKRLIPKTLHYCWFGGSPLPPVMKKCVESWKAVCPDYEIVEWNEDNYDVKRNRFVREAHQAGKWAFVSDVVRMDVVYRYGGVYLDTDVELIKPLDRFLYDPAFCGMEFPNFPALSLPFGAVSGNVIIGALRDMYNTLPFIKPDGEYDMTPCTKYHAMLFRELGLSGENSLQRVGGFTVYPMDVFCPLHPNLVYECLTENTHSIHYYTGSWHTADENSRKLGNVFKYREILTKLHGGVLYRIPLGIYGNYV